MDQAGNFRYVAYAQQVIFAPGAIAQLGDTIAAFGWGRLMLVTGRSMRRNGQAAAVEAALGERLCATFEGVQPHVQEDQVEEAMALAEKHAVDAVVGLGGGSPIGMAKAVAYILSERRSRPPDPADTSPTAQPHIAVVAIPTTYAGSEMTATYGITHNRETPPRKVTVSSPKIAPKLVIYDPQLTLDLPPTLTASTGINALAHCVEALYSVTRYPLSSAAAVRGVAHIHSSLWECYAHGEDLEARSSMLLGAHLAGYALSNVHMALHHGMCHVLGGSAGVPHGIANSIMLPHAIRFNAEATAGLLEPAAEAFGIAPDGLTPQGRVEKLAGEISTLVGRMGLPQRLRDVGVKEADLPRLAELAFQNRTVQNNPKPITTTKQLEGLLHAAW